MPGLGLHGPRPGGGRRRRGARARARRRRRAAQPRARLPLRARRRRPPMSSATSSARRRARPSAATATCTSARRRDGVFPLVSMLGDLVPLVTGAALAFKRRGEPRVAMTFLGEGAFSVGDTHEGLNLAAVWKVPAVFVIQANRYSYSTPVARQMVNTNIAQRIFGGWSIPAERVDGTDALAVLATVRAAVERARAGNGPAGGRGAHGADARPRRARRLPLRPGRDARGVRGALRPRRPPRGATRARRPRCGRDRRAARGGGGRGRGGPRRGRAGPAPDPGTIEDGVYAAPPFA